MRHRWFTLWEGKIIKRYVCISCGLSVFGHSKFEVDKKYLECETK